MVRKLKHLPFENRLRELRVFWGDHIEAFQYLKKTYRKGGEGFIIRECNARTRTNSFKQKEHRFRLGVRKTMFTVRAVRH